MFIWTFLITSCSYALKSWNTLYRWVLCASILFHCWWPEDEWCVISCTLCFNIHTTPFVILFLSIVYMSTGVNYNQPKMFRHYFISETINSSTQFSFSWNKCWWFIFIVIWAIWLHSWYHVLQTVVVEQCCKLKFPYFSWTSSEKYFIPSFFSDSPFPPSIFAHSDLNFTEIRAKIVLTFQMIENVKLPAVNVNSTCICFLWLLYPQERDPVPIVQEAGWASWPVWTGTENLTLTGVETLPCPDCSKLLYWLHYLDCQTD